MVIGVSLAITLLLMVALRSVLLPVVLVGFNLLTVAATLGVLTLLTTADDPILGDAGYIDPLAIIQTCARAGSTSPSPTGSGRRRAQPRERPW